MHAMQCNVYPSANIRKIDVSHKLSDKQFDKYGWLICEYVIRHPITSTYAFPRYEIHKAPKTDHSSLPLERGWG